MSTINIESQPLLTNHQAESVKLFSHKERENLFSNAVLVGNWFEERFADKIDRKAITPGTYGTSQCSSEKTLYKNDFQHPIPMGHREEYDEYIKWRQKGFSNRLSSERTNIILWDGDQFADNLTTFKDIMFRIKPNEDQQNIVALPSAKRRKSDDYMRSYGNSTKTGLLFWLACEKEMKNQMPIDVSHYKNHFKPIQITDKRVLHKGPQRKTSI